MPDQVAPFVVQPRLDVKPWGGDRVARLLGGSSAAGRIGEAVLTAGDVVVGSGPLAGRTMDALVRADLIGMTGSRGMAATGGRAVFPLLVKLIDADAHLSIQVHPDDAGAAPLDSLGKTEAWVVLEVADDATDAPVDGGRYFFAGLREGVDVAAVSAAAEAEPGATSALLRRLPARVGSPVFLPAGTVHALGAGVVVYELQQPCDVTYRLDDWGRVGVDGRPRQLHVAESLGAIDPMVRPAPIVPIPLPGPGRRELLVACRYFALDRFTLAVGDSVELTAEDSPQVVTVLAGAIRLAGLEVGAWQTAVVPASWGAVGATASAEAVVLRAWVPDLAADVVGPALAAGVDPERLAALSAPWPDVADAMGRETAR